jgi:hypothetical protein
VKTKKARLLALLQRQWVSPLDCLFECHLYTLAQRVSEFRAAGVIVEDRWAYSTSGSRFKEYRVRKL